MFNYSTRSVIFIFLALFGSSCAKTPTNNLSTDGILPGPLKIANNVAQCPDINGTFTFEKEDGTTFDTVFKLDTQDTPPIFTVNNSKFLVDGSNHTIDTLNEYQAGCANGAIIVQMSIGSIAMSKSEYRLDNDSLTVIRKSLDHSVTIVGPEKVIGKLKKPGATNEN